MLLVRVGGMGGRRGEGRGGEERGGRGEGEEEGKRGEGRRGEGMVFKRWGIRSCYDLLWFTLGDNLHKWHNCIETEEYHPDKHLIPISSWQRPLGVCPDHATLLAQQPL